MKRKKILPAGLISLLLLICCLSFSSYFKDNVSQTEDERFTLFTQELFQSQISADTLNLHYTFADPAAQGIEAAPAGFLLYSPESEALSGAMLENTREALQEFSREKLSPDNQLTWDILDYQLQQELQLASFSYYEEIFSPTLGIQAQLPVLLAEYAFRSEQDIKDYLALLCQLDTYYSSLMEYQKRKSQAGRFMSDETADAVISQCKAFLQNPKEHVLLETFQERIAEADFLNSAEKTAYINSNRAAVAGHVFPAYELLMEELSNLKGTGVNPYGLGYYDQGCGYYEALTACTTGTGRSMEEILSLLDMQMASDLTTITEILTTRPELLKTVSYHMDAQEPAFILDLLEQKMLQDFPAVGRVSCTVKYVTPSLEKYLSPAFYLTPPLDQAANHVIYINPAGNFDSLSLFTTLAHEGYPGHLYQTVYEQSLDLDPVRNLFYFGGYVEGWATYVENISYAYTGLDPDMAALLAANSFLSLGLHARADVGIHYEGWTPEDMAAFFAVYGIDNPETIESIYQAILQDPGNYLKYYLGAAEILQLRKTAEEVLGDAFVSKDFHEFLLRLGPAPFPVIETYLKKWLSTQRF